MKLNENKLNWLHSILIVLIIGVSFAGSCGANKELSDVDKQLNTINVDSLSPNTVDKSFSDTVGNKYTADAQLFEVSRSLNITLNTLKDTRDTLADVRDILNNAKEDIQILNAKLIDAIKAKDVITRTNNINREKLVIAQYKLLRIREYNRIAAQRKNLKYLRGWINRVLDK